jgi:hypothetical protein
MIIDAMCRMSDIFRLLFIYLFIVVTDKVERNCYFPAPGWNCMTHRQALQGFLDKSQLPLHKNNTIKLPVL